MVGRDWVPPRNFLRKDLLRISDVVRELRRASHKYVNSSPSESTRLQAVSANRVQHRYLRAVHKQDGVVFLPDLLLVDPRDKFFHDAAVPLNRTDAEHDLAFVGAFLDDVLLGYWIATLLEGRVLQKKVESATIPVLLAQLQAGVDVGRRGNRVKNSSQNRHVVCQLHADGLVSISHGCPVFSTCMAQNRAKEARCILYLVPLFLRDPILAVKDFVYHRPNGAGRDLRGGIFLHEVCPPRDFGKPVFELFFAFVY